MELYQSKRTLFGYITRIFLNIHLTVHNSFTVVLCVDKLFCNDLYASNSSCVARKADGKSFYYDIHNQQYRYNVIHNTLQFTLPFVRLTQVK